MASSFATGMPPSPWSWTYQELVITSSDPIDWTSAIGWHKTNNKKMCIRKPATIFPFLIQLEPERDITAAALLFLLLSKPFIFYKLMLLILLLLLLLLFSVTLVLTGGDSGRNVEKFLTGAEVERKKKVLCWNVRFRFFSFFLRGHYHQSKWFFVLKICTRRNKMGKIILEKITNKPAVWRCKAKCRGIYCHSR